MIYGPQSTLEHTERISAFIHMQSNGAVDGTDDWETEEAEGPPIKNQILFPKQDNV